MSVNVNRESSIHMDDQKNSVSLASIVIDDRFQTRAALDHAAIEDYIEAIRVTGRWPFPPIKIVSQFLVDGFHRVTAAKRVAADPETAVELRKSLQSIPCERVSVDLTSDNIPMLALQHALAANQTHGLRRTNADKRRAIELALKCWPDRSDREIAKLTGTSHPNVGAVRAELRVEILPAKLEEKTEPVDFVQVENLPPSSELESETHDPREVATLPDEKQRASRNSDEPKPNPEDAAKKLKSLAHQHRDKLVCLIDDYGRLKRNHSEQLRLVSLIQSVSLW